MNIFEQTYLLRLQEIVKQTFSPEDPIKNETDVIKCLIYIVNILRKFGDEISFEHTSDQLDKFLPGTREQSGKGLHLFEVNSGDDNVQQAQKNVLLTSISNFLKNNPNSFIEGLDQIISIVERNTQNVREEDHDPMSDITRNLISTFKVLLGTFNNLIVIVDDHNELIRSPYQRHNKVVY